MRRALVVVCLSVLAACGSPDPGPDDPEGQPGAPAPSVTPSEAEAGSSSAGPGRFDGLTIELKLAGRSVRSGEEIAATLFVTNETEKTIVDPACLIGSGRHALVPADDPHTELWLQPVVDCQGPFRMPPGFGDSYEGTTFPARSKFGDNLPPGDYIAAMEIEGYSTRLEQPVEVTD